MKAQRSIPLLVVAAALLAYQNSLTGPLILDDIPSIQENVTIRHLWPIWQPLSPPHQGGITVEGRPLLNLSFAINYALGGTKVWGYHVANLAIHILAGLTLLGIVRRTLRQPRLRERFGAAADELAVIVSVIWTVHPLQTESVTYIVQRAESLMGLFYLLVLYCFIRAAGSPRSHVWYGLSLAACVLGMATKEVMASAPLLVLLYDRAFVSESLREAWRRRWAFYVALASTWIPLACFLSSAGSFHNTVINASTKGIGWRDYVLTEPGALLHYLRLSVWPDPLCLDYGSPVARTWASILLPALPPLALLGATAWACRRNSAWGFLGAWFFLILAPSSSFIPLDSPRYEHRMYLSLAAVVACVVLGLYSVAGRRSLAALVSVAIGFGFLTARRNEDYRSDIVLWEDTVAKRPGNYGAHCNLGVALAQAGNRQEAIRHFEEALRIWPDCPAGHYNLALAFSQIGRTSEAIWHYERALQIRPRYAEAHYNLGSALSQMGRTEDAIRHYEEALQIQPDYPESDNNLGIALVQIGKAQDAIGHFERALRLRPDYAEAHNNLGIALVQTGKIPDAIPHFEQALRLKPHYADAYCNLGVALAQSGRVPEAIDQLQQALRLQPDLTRARDALARLQPRP